MTSPTAALGPTTGPILITGGAGFLGRHLAGYLRSQGHKVRTLDVRGASRGVGSEDVPVDVLCDVRDEAAIAAEVQAASAVLHLAAVVGVQRYVADPLAVLDVNILGTRNVLRAAHQAGVPVVFTSTSEMHGANVTPLHEGEASIFPDPARPRWSYGISKLTGEHYARALHRAGLRVGIVRMFNIYGPGLDAPGKGRVVSRFIGQIQRDEPLTLVDRGTEVRALCYIDDAVRAIGLVLDHVRGLEVRAAAGESDDAALEGQSEVPTFAIGRDEPVTMAQLAARMAWFSGHTAGTVDVSAAHVFGEGIAKIPHRVPRLGHLEAVTGFRAEISLNEGLQRTLAAVDLLKRTDPPPPDVLPFVRPDVAASTHLLQRMGRALATGVLTNQGPAARELEATLSARLGATTLAVSNGTAALMGALTALGVRGTAILPSFTFAATRNAAVWCGLQVCYCDIDPHTWTLDPEALAAVLKTQADVGVILPVTAYGVTPDLDAIRRVAGGIPVVLDDAHGFGARRDGHEVHPGVAATTMSFHATKVLPAAEGGAIAFADPAAAAAFAQLRNHGLDAARPLDGVAGLNLKLSELHATVALHGLADFEATLSRRRAYLHRLREAANSGFQLQALPDAVWTNGQNFAVLVPGAGDADTRAAVARLRAAGVGSRRYFWPALHRTAAAVDDGSGPLPHTEFVSDRVLCLPLYARMREPELAQIEAGLRGWSA